MSIVRKTVEVADERACNSPQEEYLRRREDREAALVRHTRRDLSVSHGRTAVALASVLMAWMSFGLHWLSGWWPVAPAAVFVVLMVLHERTLQARQRAERAVAFYDAGLRRLENRWIGRGVMRGDFAPASHPYAADLDIFGRGSLFDLICRARTRSGQDCLANWLLKGAGIETVRERQAAVDELRARLDFREALSLMAEDSSVEAGVLESWGEAPLQLEAAWLRPAAIALAALGSAALLAWWPFHAGAVPTVVVLAASQVFLFVLRKPLHRTLHEVDRYAAALDAIAGLLSHLERELFQSPLLQRLRAELDSGGTTPSKQIKRLKTLIEWLNLQGSILFMPFARVLLWAVHFALAIDRWRATNGSRLRIWLRVCGEFEALSSLAGYAYENPVYPFPELVNPARCSRP